MSNRDRALFLAGLNIPVVPEHTPDPSTSTGCDCHHADCIKPGKHPRTKKGSLDATTNVDQITSWWDTIWPHANIGTDAGKAGLVIIAPDCPERDAEFQALGLEGAMVVQSGGGEGHKQYWYKRSPDFPQTRVCKPDDYDIMSNGNVIMPGSRHASGRLYSFVGEPIAIDQLPEQPAWVWNWVKKARANGATAGGEDDPPVRLHLRGLKRWDGEVVQKKKNGDTDRSDSLYYLALDLAECNASQSAIVTALINRDAVLGWCKYTDRDDADDRYGEIAEKVLAYEDERRAAPDLPTSDEATAEAPPSAPSTSGSDGAQTCLSCARLGKQVREQAKIIEVQKQAIAGERAERERLGRLVNARAQLDRNPDLSPTDKLVHAAALDLAYQRKQFDDEQAERQVVYMKAIRERTNVGEKTASTSLEKVPQVGKQLIYDKAEDGTTIRKITILADLPSLDAAIRAVSNYHADEVRNHGGARTKVHGCPNGCHAPLSAQTTMVVTCTGCGQLTAEIRSKPRLIEQEESKRQDDAYQRTPPPPVSSASLIGSLDGYQTVAAGEAPNGQDDTNGVADAIDKIRERHRGDVPPDDPAADVEQEVVSEAFAWKPPAQSDEEAPPEPFDFWEELATADPEPPSDPPPPPRYDPCRECGTTEAGPGGLYCGPCMAAYYEANPHARVAMQAGAA